MRINALGNTATDFASDDYIALDGTTNGSRKMKNDSLLKVTAQNALAGNVAPAFDPTRTSANQYTIGQSCIYDGKSYTFISNHYGAWSSSDVVLSDEADRLPLSVEKTFSIVGGNLATKYKVFPCEGVDSIRVKPTPNPWPTDTIGGMNPSILIIFAVAADGTATRLIDRMAGGVPNEIDLTLPSGTKYIKFFVRANSGSVVTFNVANLYYINTLSDVTQLKSDVTQLKSDVCDLENDLVTHGSLSIPLTGANITGQIYYVGVKGLVNVSVTPTPNPWPTDTIGGLNPNILILSSVNSVGVETALKTYSIGSTIPAKIDLTIPSGGEKLRIFFRANSGSVVTFAVKEEGVSEPLGDCFEDSFSIIGAGLAAKNHYVQIKDGVEFVKVEVSPSPWPMFTGGSNPTIYQLDAEDAVGSSIGRLETYFRDTSNPNCPMQSALYRLPSGTKQLHFFVRAGSGEKVTIKTTALAFNPNFSNEDLERVNCNAYRRSVRIPQCLLVGDPHGYLEGFKSAVEFSGKISELDFVICVGDICPDHPTSSGAYDNYQELFKCRLPVLPVVGNHDVGSSSYIGNYLPTEKVVENVMKPAIDKGYIPNNTRGYYFLDFASMNLRVIVLNAYEVGGAYDNDNSKWARVTYDSSAPEIEFSTSYTTGDKVNIAGWTDYSYEAKENVTTPAAAPSSWSADIPCWSYRRPDTACFAQTQAQWFADTLLSTPANYGVVVVMHTSFTRNFAQKIQSKFNIKGFTDASILAETSLLGNSDFIADVVDAFMRGVSFSETIDYSTITPYNVSCDFTRKNTGVHFVGFVGGHFHKDLVLEHTTYTYQKGVYPSAIGSYLNNTDIRFLLRGKIFYCNFTAVAFDIANEAMKLVKVGAKLTDDGYLRDCERLQ